MPLRLTYMSFDLYYLRKITTITASKLLCNDRQSMSMFLSCNVYLEYERFNPWILVNERLTISSLRLMTHYVCLIYTALVSLVVNLSLIDVVNRWNWNNLFYSSTLRDSDLEDFQRVWDSLKCLNVFLLIQACVKRFLTNLCSVKRHSF